MPWDLPDDARTPERLSDWWLGTCRKASRHEQLFVALGWGDRLSRLFAVACARTASCQKRNARSATQLELCGRFADGLVTEQEMLAGGPTSNWDDSLPAAHQAVAVVMRMKPEFAVGW